MDYAFKRTLARRGSIFWLPNVKFPDGTKDKYCVIMEDFHDGMDDLVAVFTTSRTEFAYRNSAVLVGDGTINGIDGDTLIDLNNCHKISTNKLLKNSKVRYLDTLPSNIMTQIDNSLNYATKVEEELFIRMLI